MSKHSALISQRTDQQWDREERAAWFASGPNPLWTLDTASTCDSEPEWGHVAYWNDDHMSRRYGRHAKYAVRAFCTGCGVTFSAWEPEE